MRGFSSSGGTTSRSTAPSTTRFVVPRASCVSRRGRRVLFGLDARYPARLVDVAPRPCCCAVGWHVWGVGAARGEGGTTSKVRRGRPQSADRPAELSVFRGVLPPFLVGGWCVLWGVVWGWGRVGWVRTGWCRGGGSGFRGGRVGLWGGPRGGPSLLGCSPVGRRRHDGDGVSRWCGRSFSNGRFQLTTVGWWVELAGGLREPAAVHQ